MTRRSTRHLFTLVILLLALWGTRLAGLEALPLHNDEGLHLTRAVEVWRGHPFWEISDGKIINHWLIAFFYPQNTPVFAGRIATVLVALPGLAAAYAISRRWFGAMSAFLTGVFWIATPYLFFFERMAQSDVQAGALVVVTLWAALCFTRRGRWRDAMLTGLALSGAALFKLSAAPFALLVLLIVLLAGQIPPRRRIEGLVVVGIIGVASFAIPMAYLWTRTGDVFSIALGWIGIGGGSGGPLFAGAGGNLQRLAAQLFGDHAIAWGMGILLGLVGVVLAPAPDTISPRFRPAWRRNGLLLAASLLPMLPMLLLSTEVEPRHFVVGLPLNLALAGAGWGVLINGLTDGHPRRWILTMLVGGALVVQTAPFVRVAVRDPGSLTMPARMTRQYITDHSAGFGLREAVLALPETVETPDSAIIAMMFGDSCRRANFYSSPGHTLQCPDFPGTEAIQTALAADNGPVYVLQDATLVTPEIATLAGEVTLMATYPRPGETEDTASVRLWRLDGLPR